MYGGCANKYTDPCIVIIESCLFRFLNDYVHEMNVIWPETTCNKYVLCRNHSWVEKVVLRRILCTRVWEIPSIHVRIFVFVGRSTLATITGVFISLIF